CTPRARIARGRRLDRVPPRVRGAQPGAQLSAQRLRSMAISMAGHRAPRLPVSNGGRHADRPAGAPPADPGSGAPRGGGGPAPRVAGVRRAATFAAWAACGFLNAGAHAAPVDAALARIRHIVVIYGENRSFDNLYGLFPGADGIGQASAEARTQLDRDGSILPALPPVWNANGTDFDPRFGTKLANGPFRIDAQPARLPLSVPTRDLMHRYYQSVEQIDGGRNDRFAAVSDA